MKKVLLLAAAMISVAAFSKSNYIKGEGRFYAKESDSLTFVKKQLLVSAFRNIATKEIESMGLDPNKFWQAYDSKFEEYFNPTVEKIKRKYLIGDDFTVKDEKSKKQMESYQNELRIKRLTQKASFGRLSRVISSYVVNKMTRSTQMANSRYINLQAKVDRGLLTDIYTNFTQKFEVRHFKKLFLTTNFSLNGLTWKDVGVSVESDFTNVLKEHWRNWLEENLNSYVDEIVFADEQMRAKLNSYAKIPLQAVDTIHRVVNEKNSTLEFGNSVTTELVDIEDSMKNSLWLNIKIDLKKVHEDSLLKERKFEFSGDYSLMDLKMNRLVSFYDFIKESSTLSYEKSHSLSSSVASVAYRMPLGKLQEVPGMLSTLSVGLRRILIDVQNVSSLNDIVSLQKVLREKGLIYKFDPKVLSLGGSTARVALNYKGDNDKVKELLVGLRRVQVGRNRYISYPENEAPFTLELKLKEKLQNDDYNKIRKKHRLGKEKTNV